MVSLQQNTIFNMGEKKSKGFSYTVVIIVDGHGIPSLNQDISNSLVWSEKWLNYLRDETEVALGLTGKLTQLDQKQRRILSEQQRRN